jgi:hypothetical protein
VLTEEKLDDIGNKLEHTPRKSLKRLAQETWVSKSSARGATQLLKLKPCKTTVIYASLRARNLARRIHFCSWFPQSVAKGEINPQLTFFSDEAWFHLQGYTNMQNNCYWNSQNPHLAHEVPLHPVKVGVWCAVSARRSGVPMFFNETIHCERYLHVDGQHFQHLWSVNCNYFITNVIGYHACWFIGKICTCITASGALVAVKCKAMEPVNKVKILPE